jgi:hypothetical protein
MSPQIDPIIMNAMIICVGFAVDYTAHVTHQFYASARLFDTNNNHQLPSLPVNMWTATMCETRVLCAEGDTVAQPCALHTEIDGLAECAGSRVDWHVHAATGTVRRVRDCHYGQSGADMHIPNAPMLVHKLIKNYNFTFSTS